MSPSDQGDSYGALRAELNQELSEQSDSGRVVTTPYDDPIVQACVDNGGHFWPEGAPEDEPSTCTRCWFNPGWIGGQPRDEHTDDPQG